MIHPQPILLDDTLRCFVELVPEPSKTVLKPLVADPARPLESVRLHFYRGDESIGTIGWNEMFTASGSGVPPTGHALRARLADRTALSMLQLQTIKANAIRICDLYGYESYVQYVPIRD